MAKKKDPAEISRRISVRLKALAKDPQALDLVEALVDLLLRDRNSSRS